MRIIDIVATRCQILRLIGPYALNLISDPAGGGAYSAPQSSIAAFKGPTSRGREGCEGRGGERKRGEGKGWEVFPALLIPLPDVGVLE